MLMISGALAGGAVGCSQSDDIVPVSADRTYTNNHYIPGVGYYHAPYHGWYPFPYNSYSPQRGYYYGGNWNAYPDEQKETASRPSSSHVTSARSKQEAARRGGFGSSSRRSTST